jgi:dihydroxyacetone kinase-like protein
MAAISVSLTGATHPVTGGSLAVLNDDEMGIGMGQHGEGGGYKVPIKTSAETVALLMDELLKDLDVQKGEKLMCVVNGCGATTLMEQLITYRDAVNFLKDKGIEVVANMVGEVLTVQETGGYQLFIARMDDELLSYWKEASHTPYYKS